MTATVTWNGPRFGRGLNPRKHFEAPPKARHVGARLGAPLAAVSGSWDMLDAVGGTGNQFSTSRCFGFASKKAFGLFQYGQSGTPIEFSADWAYGCAISEIRRVELGGSPTFQQLEASPLADTGSEPSAGFDAFRRIGLAPEAAWPTGTSFNPRELDLGGAIAGDLWKPEAAGFVSVVAAPGPALTEAAMQALSPFADGKRGQCLQVSVASSTAAFDGADGSKVLASTDFGGADYDHAVTLLGYETVTTSDESPTGKAFLLGNSWDSTQWGQACLVPELDTNGHPTGQSMPFPGCVWVTEKALWVMADWSTVSS